MGFWSSGCCLFLPLTRKVPINQIELGSNHMSSKTRLNCAKFNSDLLTAKSKSFFCSESSSACLYEALSFLPSFHFFYFLFLFIFVKHFFLHSHFLETF